MRGKTADDIAGLRSGKLVALEKKVILEGVVLPCGVAVVTVEMRFYWNPIKTEIESQEVVVATVVDMASKTLKGKNSVA